MSNITNNRLNQIIPQADVDTVIQSLETVNTTLPFLIGLEAEEKRSLQSINGSNKVFVEDCLNEMGLSPDILPNFIDPQEVPTILTAIGSAAIGAIAGLLAPPNNRTKV